tara:strand:- start:275 stop:757 length:483 start_codon:yes stop_codon:yes gene_type:complete
MINFNKLSIKSLIDKPKIHEIVLIILFLLIIFTDISKVLDMPNNIVTYSIFFVLIIILFKSFTPIVGIVFVIAVIKILNMSNMSNMSNISNSINLSNNINHNSNNSTFNNNNISNNDIVIKPNNDLLEIQQVNNVKKPTFDLGKKTYDGLLCDTYNAKIL